jgi:hypothetical protein
MTKNFAEVGAAAAAAGADMTKTTKGGGDGPKVPAAGPVRLRLIGYVECGIQKITFQGQEQEKPRFKLIFELSGKNHAPREFDGKKQPWLLELEETLSRSEKANATKLFAAMNYDNKHQHFAQMLGEAFLGEVFHRKYPRKSDDKANPAVWTGVSAELRQKGQPYSIKAPRVLDPETDELKAVKVEPALMPQRCFIWDHADMQQWESLFIDGTYPELKDEKTGKVIFPERTRNVLQAKIKAAVNFDGSTIDLLLSGGSLPKADDAGDVPHVASPDRDDDIPF